MPAASNGLVAAKLNSLTTLGDLVTEYAICDSAGIMDGKSEKISPKYVISPRNDGTLG